MSEAERILVIKLSALGDFVQALGPFRAIREHHPQAHITLLTTRPYVGFAKYSPYFDAVWEDEKAPRWRLDRMVALARRLNQGRFDRVYDLQTSGRSSFYFRLFSSPKPAWSGIAKGCSHPHANPARDAMHTADRQAEQLAQAGIPSTPPPDLSWVEACAPCLKVERPFVLLVPGGAPSRPEKRWPVERYAALARAVAERGFTPAVLGSKAEREEARIITAACPRAVDFTERTSLYDIVGLAREAAFAVGNDTGPMHLIAATGCASLVLYAEASDPKLCGQRGPQVTILRKPRLDQLDLDEVLSNMEL
ncbi:MAG: glycosyl transferase [Alphaproteobacteria bacterium RIFOXYD12_FULL_60_8]|nr:MAG: glycosyl transferase [Alphaproteobacteria bacterium RIFOXYD12_FULL_60_8]